MGHWGQFEHGPRHGGRFGRGDLRLVILEMLENHPSYGYEIMRALEQRFHGFYSPSAGTIYPTLQWLQDLGYVTVAEEDGRKVYTITEEGRRFLAAGEPRVDEIWERMRGWAGPFDKREFREEMRRFTDELRDMGRDLRHEARWASPEKLRRVREIVVRAGREIEDVLRAPEPAPGTPPGAGPSEAAESDQPHATPDEPVAHV